MITVGGFHLSFSFGVLGAIIGMTYGLLAVGLVLIYRANQVINLAHAQLGAVGGVLLGVAVIKWQLPYWIAFALAVVASAALGTVAELAVVQRLRAAPKVTSLVATLGVAAVLATLTGMLRGTVPGGSVFPQPSGVPTFSIGSLLLTPAYVAELVLTPVLVLALAVFLRRSRYGLALRAAAANPTAARMSGISVARTSRLAWALAGGLSAFTAALVLPTQGFAQGDNFGSELLLKALAAGVAARLTSLPIALGVGVLIGVIEQEMLFNDPAGTAVDLLLFVLILIGLLLQRRPDRRGRAVGNWSATRAWTPLPPAYRAVRSVRALRPATVAALLGLALAFPFLASDTTTQIAATIIAAGLVALSIGVVTGLSGQLSLGQFAFAGIGAAGYYGISVTTRSDLLALLGAGLAAAVAATIVGLPALRIRGLMLAVTTLAFALAQGWILSRAWRIGGGRELPTPALGSFRFDTGRRYYFFALAVLVFGTWLAGNVRQSGLGRSLVALRDNETAARAFTVPATLRALQAFAVAGFLAGLGGAVLAGAYGSFGASDFSVDLSTNAAAGAVLGGLGILIGPLLGILYIFGVPAFVPLDSAAQAGTALGWLLVVLYLPGGLGTIVRVARDRIADALARRAGLDPAVERALPAVAPDLDHPAPRRATVAARRPAPADPTAPVLRGEGLVKSFGGIRAVAGVDLTLPPGQTLGLIGANGAGKTTLFELLGGFQRPDAGRVLLGERDVTRLAPERRAGLGLVRSFQDATLFPNSTVRDAVRVAGEGQLPSRLLACAIGARRTERRRAERAHEVIALMGLDPWQDRMIGDLSTGVRRITELACIVMLEPSVLLLDEPSAGIAQRETEALAELIARLRTELALSIVLIEHDMPFVMGLADQIMVMDTGRVIARGTPAEIERDPAVIAAYLGADRSAIRRSDAALTIASSGD